MYFASNGVPIGTSFSARATFPPDRVFQQGFSRVDVFSIGTDAVVQLLEEGDMGWIEDQTQEILCPLGFSSIPMENSRFVAARFKIWSGTVLPSTGIVHIRFFA